VGESAGTNRSEVHASNPRFYGTEGNISVVRNTVFVAGIGKDDSHEAPPLPVASSAQYFVDCIRSGNEPEGILNPYIAADACRILDAAVKSNKSGCSEKP
jgi:predicted dehydrogenase